MKIKFLASSKPDLRWFKQYYTKTFPAGRENANRQYRAFLLLLRESPGIGRAVEDEKNTREYPIPRTPFTVLYRIMPEHIEVMRVYDQRSDFSNRNLKPREQGAE